MAKERIYIPEGFDGWAWHNERAHVMPRAHTHAQLEMNLVLAGEAAYLVDGVRQDIRANMLLWLHPSQDHLLLDQGPDFDMWVVVFRPQAVRRICTTDSVRQLARTRPGPEFCRQVSPSARRTLDRLLKDLVAAEGNPAYYNAGVGWLLHSAWQAFGEGQSLPEPAHAHPAVVAAARLLRHREDSPGLAVLAEATGVSPSHLSRLFKRQTGMSVVTYRNRVQLDRFFSAYADGHRCTMMAAALEAGFGSYAQFHRVFRSQTGMSPRDYARRGLV